MAVTEVLVNAAGLFPAPFCENRLAWLLSTGQIYKMKST